MFKILGVQTLNNLSNERTEYLINDRLSSKRVFGLAVSDWVPDAKAIWLFRERLTQASAIEILLTRSCATQATFPRQAGSWTQSWWRRQSSAIPM